MGMMDSFKTTFKIECKKVPTKRNLIVFIAFSIILGLFVHFSMIDYKSDDKEAFKEIEEEKAKQYVFWDQYGGHGIKLKFLANPISILHSSSILSKSLSSVNTAEKLNIYSSITNKDLFLEDSFFLGFSGIVLIFGALFGIIGGHEIKKNSDYLRFASKVNSNSNIFLISVLSKLIILISTFAVLITICLLWLLINGVNLFDSFILVIFLMVTFILSFFFAVGVFVGSIIKDKSTQIGVLAVFYIVSVLFYPLLMSKINQFIATDVKSLHSFELKNLKEFMEIERRGLKEIGIYKNDGNIAPEKVRKIIEDALIRELEAIKKREQNRKDQILNKIKVNHTLLSLFPVTFYLSVNKEISGCGALGFIDFYSFSQKSKNDFIIYIIKMKFYSKAKRGIVKPFSKREENKNIFFAQSHLPYNLGLGIGVTVLLILGLLFTAYRMHLGSLKSEIKGVEVDINFEDKNTVFVLCKNKTIKEGIFNHYKQKDAVCIAKINPDDFRMNGIKPVDLLKHLCKIAGVEEKKARENLGIMEVDIDTAENSNETLLTIYVAVNTAREQELIVIDDLFKKESRQFETRVFRLLSRLETAGKKLIYLSTEMYNLIDGIDEQIHIDTFGVFFISLEKITLR